jgi:hypothetical protein
MRGALNVDDRNEVFDLGPRRPRFAFDERIVVDPASWSLASP